MLALQAFYPFLPIAHARTAQPIEASSASPARAAMAATWLKRNGNPLTRLHGPNIGPRLDDVSNELMAQNKRRREQRLSFDNGPIEVAGGHGDRPDDDIGGGFDLGSRHVDPFNLIGSLIF